MAWYPPKVERIAPKGSGAGHVADRGRSRTIAPKAGAMQGGRDLIGSSLASPSRTDWHGFCIEGNFQMAFTPVPIGPSAPPETVEFIPDTSGAYFRFMTPSYPVAAIDQSFGSDGVFSNFFGDVATGYGLAVMDTAAGAITRYDDGTAPGANAQVWTDGVNIKGVFDGSDFSDWIFALAYGVLGDPISSVSYPLLPATLSGINLLGSKDDGGDGMVALWRYTQNATPDDNDIYIVELTPTTSNLIGPVITVTEADYDLLSNGFAFMRENGGFYYIYSAGGGGGLYVLKVATDGSTAEQLSIEPTDGDLDLGTFSFIGGNDNVMLAAGRDFDGETVLLEMTPAFDSYIRTNIYDFFMPDGAMIFADDTRLFSSFDVLGTFIPYVVPIGETFTNTLKIADGIKLPCYSPCVPLIIKEDFTL